MTDLTKWPSSKYKQQVTYWKKSGQDNYASPTYDAPVCVLGRWEDRIELFINAAGEEQKSSSMVWMSCDIFEGDYVYLGESTALDPASVVDAREIRHTVKVPGWKNNQWTEVRAML